MKVLSIILDTVVDGPGLRASVYLAGCKHRCPGCHNPQSWNFDAGQEMTVQEIVDKLVESGHKKFTISGGDPFYQPENLYNLVREIKTRIPNSDIWCYTGFTYEELQLKSDCTGLALRYIDTLVDGPFIQDLRDENLKFRGSSNQRIIHLNKNKEL